MNAWLAQHVQALNLVLRRFHSNKLNTLLICLAIAVTLALPSILYAVLHSISSMTNTVQTESQLSIFLKAEQSDEAQNNITSALKNNPNISRFQFVSNQDALSQLQASYSNNEVLNAIEQNPLPDAFFVQPKQLDAESIAALKTNLSALDGVEEVLVDGAWVKRLNYLLALGRQAMLVISALLAFAIVAVIGNTIRMQIITQLAEIELSQLIGATKGFIRRPFLYAGALYGLFGGLLALVITFAVLYLFNQSVAAIAAEYETDFLISYPDLSACVAVCFISVLLGLISAHLAVTKSLIKS